MNQYDMTSSAMPNTLLTCSIHTPGRNRLAPNATAKNNVPMPSAYVNSSEAPNATECPCADDLAINASKATSAGPLHGAEMKPDTSPMRNAPTGPAPPTVLSRLCSDTGSWRSKAPNMLAASASSSTVMGSTTRGSASQVPNAPPVDATSTPSEV